MLVFTFFCLCQKDRLTLGSPITYVNLSSIKLSAYFSFPYSTRGGKWRQIGWMKPFLLSTPTNMSGCVIKHVCAVEAAGWFGRRSLHYSACYHSPTGTLGSLWNGVTTGREPGRVPGAGGTDCSPTPLPHTLPGQPRPGLQVCSRQYTPRHCQSCKASGKNRLKAARMQHLWPSQN